MILERFQDSSSVWNSDCVVLNITEASICLKTAPGASRLRLFEPQGQEKSRSLRYVAKLRWMIAGEMIFIHDLSESRRNHSERSFAFKVIDANHQGSNSLVFSPILLKNIWYRLICSFYCCDGEQFNEQFENEECHKCQRFIANRHVYELWQRNFNLKCN